MLEVNYKNNIFRYRRYKDTIEITGYTSLNKDVEIPKTIDGCPVISIEPKAFINADMESITIPSTVEYVHKGVFISCINLNRIDIDFNATECCNGTFALPYVHSTEFLKDMEIKLLAHQILDHFGIENIVPEMYTLPIRETCTATYVFSVLDDKYKTFSMISSFAESFIPEYGEMKNQINYYEEHFDKTWSTPLEFGKAIINFVNKLALL